MKKILSIALLLLMWTTGFSQINHPYIKHFSAQSQDGKLFLAWTTHAGFSCQDIEIEVGTDSINFDYKGTYFGICGDFDEKDYTYVVEDAFPNTINYIRLDLGSFGYSYIISERVIKLDRAVLIIPSPATKESQLYIDNSGVDEVIVNFYNERGKLIHTLSTDKDHVNLGEITLGRGLIIYQILYPKEAIRGKFFNEE